MLTLSLRSGSGSGSKPVSKPWIEVRMLHGSVRPLRSVQDPRLQHQPERTEDFALNIWRVHSSDEITSGASTRSCAAAHPPLAPPPLLQHAPTLQFWTGSWGPEEIRIRSDPMLRDLIRSAPLSPSPLVAVKKRAGSPDGSWG